MEITNKQNPLPETEKGRLSIVRCRAILGKDYASLSDQQINAVRILFEVLADMAISSFMRQRQDKSSNRPAP